MMPDKEACLSGCPLTRKGSETVKQIHQIFMSNENGTNKRARIHE